MLGLSAKLGLSKKRGGGFSPYSSAVIQLDAVLSGTQATNSVWPDLKGGDDWALTNGSIVDAGTVDAYYDFAGTCTATPPSTLPFIRDFHKTTAGTQGTFVLVGKTKTQKNDYIMGTVNSSASSGWAARYLTSGAVRMYQFDEAANVNISPAGWLDNEDFILIVSRDQDTGLWRTWDNSFEKDERGFVFSANEIDADSNFIIGGLNGLAELHAEVRGFMAFDTFIDDADAADIIRYYNTIHGRTYVDDPLNTLFAGQSNDENMFTDYSGAGVAQYATTAGAYFPAVNTINGSTGGSGVDFREDNGNGAYLADKSAYCGTFDGVNDYVSIPRTIITDTDALLFHGFVYRSGNGIQQGLLSQDGGAGDRGFAFRLTTSNQLEFFASPDGNTTNYLRHNTVNAFPSGVTKEVLIYAYDNDVRIFLDGVEEATVSTGAGTGEAAIFNASNTATKIGVSNTSNSSPFLGRLCGVQLFEGADAIAAFANMTELYTQAYIETSVFTLPISERSGTTAYDVSGNGNDGTITGATTTLGAGFWVNTQTSFDYQALFGFTYDTDVHVPALVDGSADAAGNALLNSAGEYRGENYVTLLAAVTTSTIDPYNIDIVRMTEGERGAFAVDAGSLTEAEHKAGMLEYLGYLQQDFPKAKIVLTPIAWDTNGNEHDGWGAVRRAQYEIVRDTAWVYESPASYDLTAQDDLHHDEAGYRKKGQRAAERDAAILGKRSAVGTLGLKAISAEFDWDTSDYIEVTVEHDQSTDLVVSEERGHHILVDGVNTASGTDNITRLTSSSFRVGYNNGSITSDDDVVEYIYPWGTLKGLAFTDVIKGVTDYPDGGNNQFWIDAAGLSENAAVSTVSDLSGNGNDATQGTGADQPEVSYGINLNNTFEFDGTTYLSADAIAAHMTGTDVAFSFHGVFKTDTASPAGTEVLFGAGQAGNDTPFFWLGVTSTGQFRISKRDDVNTQVNIDFAASDTSAHAISVVHTGTATSIWVDGVKVEDGTAQNVGAMTLDTFTIGALVRVAEANNITGRIGELLFYDKENTDAEVTEIQAYLKNKWIDTTGQFLALPLRPSFDITAQKKTFDVTDDGLVYYLNTEKTNAFVVNPDNTDYAERVEDFSGNGNLMDISGLGARIKTVSGATMLASTTIGTANDPLAAYDGAFDLFFVCSGKGTGNKSFFTIGPIFLKADFDVFPFVISKEELILSYNDGTDSDSAVTVAEVFSSDNKVVHIRGSAAGVIDLSINGGAYEAVLDIGKAPSFSGNLDVTFSDANINLGAMVLYQRALDAGEVSDVVGYLTGAFGV